MAADTGGNGHGKRANWMPTVAAALAAIGGGFGSYKIIDANVAAEIKANGQQITLLAARVDALGTKVGQVSDALTNVQNDRIHDLRTVFQKAEELRGAIDTLQRQLVDMKGSIDAVERRNQDADRDIKQSVGELRNEVHSALRAPLVGPRNR